LQGLDLAALAQPDLVIGRHRSPPQPGIDLEDPLRDSTEPPRRCETFWIGVGVLAGRRRQIFAPIAPFEVAQPRRGVLRCSLARERTSRSSARIWLSSRYQL
jgi:hypothetical protein